MKGFVVLFLGLTICTAAWAISSKTLDEETMQLCIQYFKKIEALEDNKQHDEARKYKSKMYRLDCPTRHNDYYK